MKYRLHLDIDPAERAALDGYLNGTCAGITAEVPPLANVQFYVEAYVTKVYNDLFGRNPDPTGLNVWSWSLRSGSPYGSVANGITASLEFRAGLINESYATYLGRGPDPSGLENWLTAMNQGLHIEQMQAGFIASPEFYARSGGTDAGWITGLYQTVLGRNPAPSEVNTWVTALGQSSRTQVAFGFLYSGEHLTTVVNGYYLHLLDRDIDPTGGQSWVSAIQGGARDEQIIAGIVASDEYRAKP